ncbi:MAG: hypothetical protein ACI9SE_002602, partial [Neolewinella sp.]
RDPMKALELADTVALVEQFRHLRTEASPEFAGKLQDVALHSDRFSRSHFQPKPPAWLMPIVGGLAAAATFLLLWGFDVAQLWRSTPKSMIVADRDIATGLGGMTIGDSREINLGKMNLGNEAAVVGEEPMSPEQASWEQAVAEILARLDRETTGNLRDAFRDGMNQDGDALKQWLDPSNAMVMLRFEHELRASASIRIHALRSRGALAEVDNRVQELADGIADEMLQVVTGQVDAIASTSSAASAKLPVNSKELSDITWGVRALIASGSSVYRAKALRNGGDWLARRLPQLAGERLAIALSGLMELATISGQHFEAVAVHGQRLVDDVLQPSDENWRRRLPELLAGHAAAGSLGEAGRMLARLPAFGVSPQRCKLVRQLMLGQLRDRRTTAQDRPEVLAAMLYGCGDLLDEDTSEADRLGWQLLRWKPTRLAPDFGTVQQIAWSRAPASRGYTRLQRELRQLAVLPMPQDLSNRAAFVMCLATNFAGHAGSLLLDDE